MSSRQPGTRPAGLSLVAVAPSTGAATGGEAVTISGKGFSSGMQVTLDGKAATAVTVRDATEAHFLTPPHDAGTVNVVVSTPDGKRSELDNAFTYVDTAAVTSLYPDSGLSSGGTLVTILGTNFQSGAQVSFGDKAAQSLVSVTPSVIQALTPPHSTGTVDVIVKNPDGAVARLTRGFRFGQILFADGFESSDFSAWRAVSKFSCSEQSSYAVTANQVHRGAFAAEFHYRIPADQCEEHQDNNVLVLQSFDSTNGFSNGLDHFFVRGYVYFKTPEPDASDDAIIGRKLLWFSDGSSGVDSSYQLIVSGINGKNGKVADVNWINVSVQSSTSCGPPSWVIWDLTDLTRDTWYSIEIEVHLNTPGISDGVERVWVNGVTVLDRSNLNLRGTCSTPVRIVSAGRQADRHNYKAVNEYRYWDDIVIADAFIGP